MNSDSKLTLDIKNRDVMAFKIFFESFYPSMCLFANKYLNDEEASRDIVQEAFIYIWIKQVELDSISSAKNYLAKYIKNRSLNYLRDSKKLDPLDLVNLETEIFFRDNVIENETYLIIDNAIHSLSPQSQRVIEMTLDGLRIKEIAGQLNISLNTVKTIKLRAFASLRNRLKKRIMALFFFPIR